MIQATIPLPIDTVLTPHDCGRAPTHVLTRGRNRHHYECTVCRVATAKFMRDWQAQAAWQAGELVPQLSSAK